ncbi:hypothetical protein BURKHO8Y_70035 [Burkholderia sp. 8Y]|nr:hypothetical protein BURKHO8Y_70035 [Burkholderia sp. 8Y]
MVGTLRADAARLSQFAALLVASKYEGTTRLMDVLAAPALPAANAAPLIMAATTASPMS